MQPGRVLVGVSGSIAAYRSCELVRLLSKAGSEVRVLMTEASQRFVTPTTLAALSGNPVVTDLFTEPERVIHVELARWADAYVICGATATTLARLATGAGDDVVAATALMHRGPLVVAPAMHTEMWEHPSVQRNVRTVVEDGALLVPPEIGDLASGDVGIGRLAQPSTIVEALVTAVTPQDLAGRSVVVTAGPTREPIDPVRFISNRSSGRMGYALANEARRRGAKVTLISGPTALEQPAGVDVITVETAAEMLEACLDRSGGADAVIMNAAVADWTPATTHVTKAGKADLGTSIALAPTVDIAAEIGKRKGRQVLVAFAAETDDVEAKGARKLHTKGADLVVANRVAAPGTGFDTDTNDAILITADGAERLDRMEKTDLAGVICDRLVGMLDLTEGTA